MGWTARVSESVRAILLSISAYARPASTLPGLDSASVEQQRAQYGGQLTLQPQTRTRWYQADVETAAQQADAGDLTLAGQLMRAVDADGVLCGIMSTRCGALVQLPRIFRGPADMVQALQRGGEQARSTFDEMCPPGELEAFAADAVKLNVAVGELCPVEGRDFPVFVRRMPEFLVYRWAENRWYYRSAVGLLPVTPGDGRWVLFTGGAEAPWQRGTWRALARAFITKDHARNYRDNWESKLANPARVGEAPAAATEEQRQSWWRKLMAWGINTAFILPPGYTAKLLESNGRGADSWPKTIAEQDGEFAIAIAGQTVTTGGGTGFQNKDIFETIRADLIKKTADLLAHTLNTQVFPAWVANVYGEERLSRGEIPALEFDITPPGDQQRRATAIATAAGAIKSMLEALASTGLELDVRAVLERAGIPILAANASGPTQLRLVEGSGKGADPQKPTVKPAAPPAEDRKAA